jgi:beta-1,4-N-acetylglucosaminyltransferase
MDKVLFVSSGGGHYTELKQLKTTMNDFNSVVVTEDNVTDESADYYLKYGTRTHLIKYLWIFLYNFFQAYKIIIKEHPRCIVSTGAHSCVPFFIIGFIFRIKLVYIESYAKVNHPSLTYKIINRLCDTIYVQHEEMLLIYPKAVYIGGVY